MSVQLMLAKARAALNAVGRFLATAVFIVAFLGVGVVQVRSCFVRDGSTADGSVPEVNEADPDEPRHARLLKPLRAAYWAAGNTGSPDVFVVGSSDLNAASLGDGRFLVWDAVADLAERKIAAIVAHEVAHDRLQHSRKYSELRDLTDFVAEVFALVSRSSPSTEAELKDLVGTITTSRYSRAQELAADDFAVELLVEMRYDAPSAALADGLCTLLRSYGDTGGGWFDSHPATSERVLRLGESPCRPR